MTQDSKFVQNMYLSLLAILVFIAIVLPFIGLCIEISYKVFGG